MPTLYHFTKRENLFGILMRGLQPGIPDPPFLTDDQAVVWLTTQTSLRPTTADREHNHRMLGKKEAARFAHSVLLGADTRLTVNIPENSKKLVPYYAWLKILDAKVIDANGTARPYAWPLSPSAKRHWFIYFGTINPAWIVDPKITAGLVLPTIEQLLAGTIKEMQWLTKERDKLKAVPLDTPIAVTSTGKCHIA